MIHTYEDMIYTSKYETKAREVYFSRILQLFVFLIKLTVLLTLLN